MLVLLGFWCTSFLLGGMPFNLFNSFALSAVPEQQQKSCHRWYPHLQYFRIPFLLESVETTREFSSLFPRRDSAGCLFLLPNQTTSGFWMLSAIKVAKTCQLNCVSGAVCTGRTVG